MRNEIRVLRLSWIIKQLADIVSRTTAVEDRDVLIAGLQELSYRQEILRRELSRNN
jgi:hypothetical protein